MFSGDRKKLENGAGIFPRFVNAVFTYLRFFIILERSFEIDFGDTGPQGMVITATVFFADVSVRVNPQIPSNSLIVYCRVYYCRGSDYHRADRPFKVPRDIKTRGGCYLSRIFVSRWYDVCNNAQMDTNIISKSKFDADAVRKTRPRRLRSSVFPCRFSYRCSSLLKHNNNNTVVSGKTLE